MKKSNSIKTVVSTSTTHKIKRNISSKPNKLRKTTKRTFHSPINSISPLPRPHSSSPITTTTQHGFSTNSPRSLLVGNPLTAQHDSTPHTSTSFTHTDIPYTLSKHSISTAVQLDKFPPGYEHPYGDLNRTRMLPTTTKSYDELKNFKVPLPYKYNMGFDICDKHVWAGNGNKRALVYVNQHNGKDYTVDYNFISQQSNRVANGLRHMGITKGDRVALLMSQSIEVAIMHAAIYKIGAIAVPLSILFGPEALQYRIQASGARALFIEPGKISDIIEAMGSDDLNKVSLPDLENIILSPHLSTLTQHDAIMSSEEQSHAFDLKGLLQFRKTTNRKHMNFFTMGEIIENGSKHHIMEETTIDDPGLIIFTSGTTGNPKAALHRHSVLLGHLPGCEFFYDLWPQKDDLIFTGSDVSWIGGLLNTLMPSLHHGVPVLLNRSKKFDADYMFELFAKYKVKNAFLPPTALKMMKQVPNPRQKHNYNLRSIGSGGESLGESILSWGRDTLGVDINEFYGQTECNLVLGNSSRLKPIKNGSMGVPIPGHKVEVINDHGEICKTGSVGQIAVKSPHALMFSGYFNNPKATAEKYIGDWLVTGDLGKKDDDGYFFYVGRNDDIISSAGYRIGPSEVETSLLHHPAVSNAAAVGVPCEIRNEKVKAFVVLDPKAQSQYFGSIDAYSKFIQEHPHGNYEMHGAAKELQHDLMNFVKSKLAKHEFPREVEFVTELPMTTTGKVIRKTLKKNEYERYYNALGKKIPEGMF